MIYQLSNDYNAVLRIILEPEGVFYNLDKNKKVRFLATFSGLVARQGKFPGNEVEHAGHVFHRPVPARLALHG